MYGGEERTSLDENSLPKSPYASSKVFAHETNKLYRESYDILVLMGYLIMNL